MWGGLGQYLKDVGGTGTKYEPFVRERVATGPDLATVGRSGTEESIMHRPLSLYPTSCSVLNQSQPIILHFLICGQNSGV